MSTPPFLANFRTELIVRGSPPHALGRLSTFVRDGPYVGTALTMSSRNISPVGSACVTGLLPAIAVPVELGRIGRFQHRIIGGEPTGRRIIFAGADISQPGSSVDRLAEESVVVRGRHRRAASATYGVYCRQVGV